MRGVGPRNLPTAATIPGSLYNLYEAGQGVAGKGGEMGVGVEKGY